MKKFLETSIMLLLALISATFLPYAVKMSECPENISNSVFSIPLLAGIYLVIKKAYRVINLRLAVSALVLGIAFSAFLIIGTNITFFDSSCLDSVLTYIKILGIVPIMWAGIVNIVYCFKKIGIWVQGISINKKIEEVLVKIKHPKILVFILFIIAWLPAFLSAFPGIYAYDSIFQVSFVMNDHVTRQHPILHTYWLGGSMKLGQLLFHSNEAGLCIYTVTQMILFASILSYFMKWLYKRVAPVIVLVIGVLTALLPYNAMFAISATKDTIFAGMFLLAILKTYEIAEDPKGFFSDFRKQLLYVITVWGMFLFRNNGVYAYYCFIPIFFIICRKYWKRILIQILIILVGWMIFTGPIYHILDIKDNGLGVREMLSVPAQQMARAMRDNSEELTSEEKKEIERYFPDYSDYEPKISDYVKDSANTQEIKDNLLAFVKLWIQVGVKCPSTYIDAWLSMSAGNWYPDQIYPIEGAWHPYMPWKNYTVDDGYGTDYEWVDRKEYLPLIGKVYEAFANGSIHQRIPAFSMLFSPGMVFWCLLFGIMVCVYRKKYVMALPFSLMAGLWTTIMLGPVVLMRYSYPLFLCVPVMFLPCISSGRIKDKEDDER